MEKPYQLEFTHLAYSDIDHALEYLRVQLENETASAELYKKIERKIETICGFPYAFPDCRYYFITAENYRHTVIGNHVLVFRILEERRTVQILRFVYSRRDFSALQMEED